MSTDPETLTAAEVALYDNICIVEKPTRGLENDFVLRLEGLTYLVDFHIGPGKPPMLWTKVYSPCPDPRCDQSHPYRCRLPVSITASFVRNFIMRCGLLSMTELQAACPSEPGQDGGTIGSRYWVTTLVAMISPQLGIGTHANFRAIMAALFQKGGRRLEPAKLDPELLICKPQYMAPHLDRFLVCQWMILGALDPLPSALDSMWTWWVSACAPGDTAEAINEQTFWSQMYNDIRAAKMMRKQSQTGEML